MFLDDLQKRFQEMQTKAGVKAVFGEVIEVDGRKVIPVASVQYGFGMGGGSGPKKKEEGEAPGGGGGGGGMRVEPIALIEVGDGKVKVQPIINVTKLALFGMLTWAWAIFWIARTVRAVAKSKAAS